MDKYVVHYEIEIDTHGVISTTYGYIVIESDKTPTNEVMKKKVIDDFNSTNIDKDTLTAILIVSVEKTETEATSLFHYRPLPQKDIYFGCDMANRPDVTVTYSVKVTNEFLDAIMSKEQRVLAGHKHYYRNAQGIPDKLYMVEDDKYIPCGKENSGFSGTGFIGITTDETGEQWIVIEIPFLLPPNRRYARLSEVEFIIED